MHGRGEHRYAVRTAVCAGAQPTWVWLYVSACVRAGTVAGCVFCYLAVRRLWVASNAATRPSRGGPARHEER